MSGMPDPKNALQGAIGPTNDLERLLTEKVEAAEDFARMGRELLRTMRGDRPEILDANRYKGLDPEAAMKVFFNSKRARAMTKDELVEELATGNIQTGAASETLKTKQANAKRSIEAQLLKKKSEYRKVGDKIGPKEWPDEKFKVE
jgi:hypothetical protein